MEEINITKKQMTTYGTNNNTHLAIHKDSQTISKAKPKIRIIHIFAPEIIKTDVANFRELVQRLTGKPTEKDDHKKTKKIKPLINIPRRPSSPLDHHHHQECLKSSFPSKPMVKEVDLKTGFRGLDDYINVRDNQRIKEEDHDQEEDEEEAAGMWTNNNDNISNNNIINNAEIINPGGFLERFADLEGFIEFEELGEFPLLPSLLPNLDVNSHVHGFGGPQLV